MIRHEELRRARRRIEEIPGTPATPSPAVITRASN